LRLEQLECRLAPAAGLLAAGTADLGTAIGAALSAATTAVGSAEATAAAAALATVGGAVATAAAIPPATGFLAGQLAGLAKAAANYVTTNVSAEQITAASQQPQTGTGAAVNFAKAAALVGANQVKTFLDFVDATADTLVQAGEMSPSPATAYLAFVAASFKAGEASSTLAVDQTVLLVDTTKNLLETTPENQKKVIDDATSLASDLKENFAFNVSVDLKNAVADIQETAAANAALAAASGALTQALKPAINPPPLLTPMPTPFPAPTPTPTPNPNQGVQFELDGDEPFPGGPDSDGDSDAVSAIA
jgi:hypothetical protein